MGRGRCGATVAAVLEANSRFGVFNLATGSNRNPLSFIKDLAPEIGRGVGFSYIVKFF